MLVLLLRLWLPVTSSILLCIIQFGLEGATLQFHKLLLNFRYYPHQLKFNKANSKILQNHVFVIKNVYVLCFGHTKMIHQSIRCGWHHGTYEGAKSQFMILRYLCFIDYKWGDNEKEPPGQIYFLIYFFETKLDFIQLSTFI